MITKETCENIWHCYREISVANELLADVEKEIERRAQPWKHEPPHIKDYAGREAMLELGVPSSENGKRLFRVPWVLARPVIMAHIAAKQKELVEFQIKARMELDARVETEQSKPALSDNGVGQAGAAQD